MRKLVSEWCKQPNSHREMDYSHEYPIEKNNWNIPTDVKVNFNIGNDDSNIYLRYTVSESNIKAVHTKVNDPVYEDSCVEFFISLEDDRYYNFEFNCIGVALGQYGGSRSERSFLDENTLAEIDTWSSLGQNRIEVVDRPMIWTLDVRLPNTVFKFSDIDSFAGSIARCNFYKCGDGLKSPHFLSWAPIHSDMPDFHRQEFFREIKFSNS